MTDRSSVERDRNRQTAVLHAAPGVRWVVETDGIVLIGPDSRSLRLTGAAAALWALVVSGRQRGKIPEMMAAISGDDTETTAAKIQRLFALWEEQGYLARRRPDG
jgi:hypothetical protein